MEKTEKVRRCFKKDGHLFWDEYIVIEGERPVEKKLELDEMINTHFFSQYIVQMEKQLTKPLKLPII